MPIVNKRFVLFDFLSLFLCIASFSSVLIIGRCIQKRHLIEIYKTTESWINIIDSVGISPFGIFCGLKYYIELIHFDN